MRREGEAWWWWWWRRAGGLGLALAMAWGCGGGGSGSATAPTGAATITVTEDAPTAKSVTVDLRDRFLSVHNAQFFGGRTFRWVPPIPTLVLTGDPAVDDPVRAQFAAWEAATSLRLFELRPGSPQIPPRGIFIGVAELPGTVIGFANLLDAPSSVWLRALQAHFPRSSGPAPRRRVEVPEILGNGQILRCEILLDQEAFGAGSGVSVFAILRHEIGHCIGFLGHVPKGLMVSAINSPNFSLTITSDVSGMLKKLYRLPLRTPVTP
jgi:hypothetical protein